MNRYIQYMYSYPHKTAYRKLENVNLADYAHELSGGGHSLYLHIPFCSSKCGYCNLFSVTGADESLFEKYTDAVIEQIKQYSKLLPPDTVFDDITAGGGTPLIMPEALLERIFENIHNYFPVKKDCDVIIETAPAQTDAGKIKLLKRLGISRVSMGVQSFDDGELKWLRRVHRSENAQRAAELLSNSGIKCVNLDFIYGIPFQTEESLTASLRRAVKYSPDEIFLYPLYIKHGVKLMEKRDDLDPEHTFRLYECGRKFLDENGFFQNSMRQFARKVNSCFSECGVKSSLSIGCGGRSYIGRLHTCTPYRITRCSALEELERFINAKDHTAVTHGIILDDDEIKRRYVIKNAFVRAGISTEDYSCKFHSGLKDDFPEFLSWINKGYFTEKDGMIIITRTGMGLSDMLAPELISENIKNKMEEWELENGRENSYIQRKHKKL